MKNATSEFIDIRGFRTHVRHWGDAGSPKLFVFHGWGDMSATWQFMVDGFKRDWHVIAPDWRGCGKSDYVGATYYFPDWLADIDAVLERYSPDTPVILLGHSMGANAVSLYAGVRPERVSHLINLEGLGLPSTSASSAPDRYAKWLRMLKKDLRFRTYPDRAALAQRLRNDNPRLTRERAVFLAGHFGVENAEGGISLALDTAHRLINPVRYRSDEAAACWNRITAPMLLITAADSHIFRDFFTFDSDEMKHRVACFKTARHVHLPDCSHNMQHDQPEVLAQIIEEFIA